MPDNRVYMKIKIIVAWGFSILFLLSSCQHHSVDTAEINGKFTDASGFKLTLQEMGPQEIRTVDSVVIEQSGMFDFDPDVKETGFWLLKAPGGEVMVLLLNTGERVDLSGSVNDFPDNVNMKAPKEAMWLNDFYRSTRENERMVDSLEMLLEEQQDNPDYYRLTQIIDSTYRQIWTRQRDEERAFIDSHPGSLASLVVLNYAFGLNPVLSIGEDFTYYQRLDSVLFIKFPENKHVLFHHQRVAGLVRNKADR